MIIHKDSHTDHTITQAQWQYILAAFEARTGFFIETLELPEALGFVRNELYGPSCGDPPVPETDVYYMRRGNRAWDSRVIMAEPRPTRFVRVIAGPHEETCTFCRGTNEHVTLGFMVQFGMSQQDATGPCPRCTGGKRKHACVLYTAYGVSSKDTPAAPKEPGDLEVQLKLDITAVEQAQAARREVHADEIDARDAEVNERIVQRDKTVEALRASKTFWAEHALATEAF